MLEAGYDALATVMLVYIAVLLLRQYVVQLVLQYYFVIATHTAILLGRIAVLRT